MGEDAWSAGAAVAAEGAYAAFPLWLEAVTVLTGRLPPANRFHSARLKVKASEAMTICTSSQRLVLFCILAP
jgi:hypothetical protein